MLEPLPTLHKPLAVESPHARHLPARAALDWLAAGWRDLSRAPGSSLAYGAAVLALSWAVLWALALWGLLYLALPALSGFLIVGPFLALGLYEKSRRHAEGGQPGRQIEPCAGRHLQPAIAGQFGIHLLDGADFLVLALGGELHQPGFAWGVAARADAA